MSASLLKPNIIPPETLKKALGEWESLPEPQRSSEMAQSFIKELRWHLGMNEGETHGKTDQ